MRGMRLLRLASLGTKAVEKKGVLSQDFSTVLFKLIEDLYDKIDKTSNRTNSMIKPHNKLQ